MWPNAGSCSTVKLRWKGQLIKREKSDKKQNLRLLNECSAEVSTSAWFFISFLFFVYIMPSFAETGLPTEKEQVTDLAK